MINLTMINVNSVIVCNEIGAQSIPAIQYKIYHSKFIYLAEQWHLEIKECKCSTVLMKLICRYVHLVVVSIYIYIEEGRRMLKVNEALLKIWHKYTLNSLYFITLDLIELSSLRIN